MDIGSILLIVALMILVGLYISQPLLTRKAVAGNPRQNIIDHDLSVLLAEKERILEALDELDNDYELGKIPEEEYPTQRADMLKRGANILRQLDSYQSQTFEEKEPARIETTIAASPTRSSRSPVDSDYHEDGPDLVGKIRGIGIANPDDELEIQIASRRRERESKSRGFCPQCGKPLNTSDRFCPKCGQKLI